MVFTILKALYLIATKKDRKDKDYSYCHVIYLLFNRILMKKSLMKFKK